MVNGCVGYLWACSVCIVEKMELKYTLRGCQQSIMSIQFDQNVRLASNFYTPALSLSLIHSLSLSHSLSLTLSLSHSYTHTHTHTHTQCRQILAAANDGGARIWTFHEERPKVRQIETKAQINSLKEIFGEKMTCAPLCAPAHSHRSC